MNAGVPAMASVVFLVALAAFVGQRDEAAAAGTASRSSLRMGWHHDDGMFTMPGPGIASSGVVSP